MKSTFEQFNVHTFKYVCVEPNWQAISYQFFDICTFTLFCFVFRAFVDVVVVVSVLENFSYIFISCHVRFNILIELCADILTAIIITGGEKLNPSWKKWCRCCRFFRRPTHPYRKEKGAENCVVPNWLEIDIKLRAQNFSTRKQSNWW